MRAGRATPLLVCLLANGCALLSRGAPLNPQYYEPPTSPHVAARGASPATTCALNLGDVSAEDNLGKNIAFRRTPSRWGSTRRAAGARARTTTCDARSSARSSTTVGAVGKCFGRGATLDARLIAFEEQRGSPHRARVAVHVILRDEHRVLAETTFDAARPIAAGDGDAPFAAPFDAFVAAVGQALDDVAGDVVRLVTSSRIEP